MLLIKLQYVICLLLITYNVLFHSLLVKKPL